MFSRQFYLHYEIF